MKDKSGRISSQGRALGYTPASGPQQFAFGSLGGKRLGVVRLEPGAYAAVKCYGETAFRAVRAPAVMGQAAGHAGLACEEPVVWAGELVFAAGGHLEAWNNMSGTYQMPASLASQSGLPPELFWHFHSADDGPLQADVEALPLRGGHALVKGMPRDGAEMDVEDVQDELEAMVEAGIALDAGGRLVGVQYHLL